MQPSCTFEKTKRKHVRQVVYVCKTCYNTTCCEFCANACHLGHDVITLGVRTAFCACGDYGGPLFRFHNPKTILFFSPGQSPFSGWNIRAEPSIDAAVKHILKPGQYVNIISDSRPCNDFLHVRFGMRQDEEGWSLKIFEGWSQLVPFFGPRIVIYFTVYIQKDIFLLRLGTNNYVMWDKAGSEINFPEKCVFTWLDQNKLSVNGSTVMNIVKEWPMPNNAQSDSDYDIDKAYLRQNHICDSCTKSTSHMGTVAFKRSKDFCFNHYSKDLKSYIFTLQPLIWSSHYQEFLKSNVQLPLTGALPDGLTQPLQNQSTDSTPILIRDPYTTASHVPVSEPRVFNSSVTDPCTTDLHVPAQILETTQTPGDPKQVFQYKDPPIVDPCTLEPITQETCTPKPFSTVPTRSPVSRNSSQTLVTQTSGETNRKKKILPPIPPNKEGLQNSDKQRNLVTTEKKKELTAERNLSNSKQNNLPVKPMDQVQESHYRRIVDVGNENLMFLSPISGISNIPILSLQDSVKSVQVHNVAQFAWMSMKFVESIGQLPVGVTNDGAASINLYTREWTESQDSLYYILNNALRNENREHAKPFFPYLKLILTTLLVLPKFKGVAWRGVKADIHSAYTKDKELFWWGFSSCTTDMEALKLFLGSSGERTLFCIEIFSGVDIKPFSVFQKEEEVLLGPGTFLKVKNKLDAGNGLNIVHLEELPTPFQVVSC